MDVMSDGDDKGRPFVGRIHSADASGGVAIPLFEAGSSDQYTLKENEYLVVSEIHIVSAAGGDTYVNTGSGAATTNSSIVFRGTLAANALVFNGEYEPCWQSPDLGGPLYLTAPAGVVDVVVLGTIHVASDGKNLSWKA